MKSGNDPRHLRRIKNMQAVFAWDCGSLSEPSDNSSDIIKNIDTINLLISTHAPKWPLEKINKVDLAVLRCAIWELTIDPQTPEKVIIDEAIEISKEFGTDNSPAFINGVLGSIIKESHESHNPTARNQD